MSEQDDVVRLCQSACGPCERLCDTCRDSWANYREKAHAALIENAIQVLEANGFKVDRPSPREGQGPKHG